MCNFYWKMCFCCNSFINAYSDAEFCGSVDCNINYIIPKMKKRYCSVCIDNKCNTKKMFCDPVRLPDILTVDKSMNSLTLFMSPSN